MNQSKQPPAGPQRGHGPGPGRGARCEPLWWWCAHATLAIGLVLAFLMWGPAPCLAAAGALGIASWAMVVALRDEDQPTARFDDWYVATCCGISAVASFGLVAAFRWLAILVLVTLVLTSPALWRWLAARRARPTPPDLPPVAAPGAQPAPADPGETDLPAPTRPALDPEALDDETLCREWRTSFVRLQAVAGPSARAQVVARRQAILDELTRRHEKGIDRWLASGARAAGNPMRFLGPTPRHHHP